MLRIRSYLFDLFVVIWTLIFAIPVPIFVLVNARRETVLRFGMTWVRGYLKVAQLLVGTRYRVEGWENLPDRSCVVIANHQSGFETLALPLLLWNVAIPAKKQLFWVPIFAWYLRKLGMIRINRERRGTNLDNMVIAANEAMQDGRHVLIFPEATRVRAGETRKFRRGYSVIAEGTQAPIVPIVHNAGSFWGPYQSYRKPGTIIVRMLPAISPGDPMFGKWEDIEAMMNREKDRLLIGE